MKMENDVKKSASWISTLGDKEQWVTLRAEAKRTGRTLQAVFNEAVKSEIEKLRRETQNA